MLAKLQSQALQLVFSQRKYILLSIAIVAGLLVLLSILSGFVYFQPNFLFYVSNEDILRFSLVVIVSALSALVVSMSIFRLKIMNTKKMNSGFVGTTIGAGAGACSCGPVGFSIVSAFGAIGRTATTFLTNYEIPLRLIAIGILSYTYYVTSKGISAQCKIQK
ncbi:MAG: hypothetical protein HZA82_05775 [Thaumarchaeota archaeon]|nr:hypothetical protein [Nitrososphaerota archaeon]